MSAQPTVIGAPSVSWSGKKAMAFSAIHPVRKKVPALPGVKRGDLQITEWKTQQGTTKQ